jgi:sodium/bile acid cotransporter 7
MMTITSFSVVHNQACLANIAVNRRSRGMNASTLIRRLTPDPYIAAILAMVGLASLFPAHGTGAEAAGYAASVMIALMFFLQGARLSPAAALGGARNWRLHLLVFASTFLVFPLLALGMRAAAPGLLPAPLWAGVVLLAVLPSTVQSSIAFTSIARGNVPAALCAATASNLAGIVLTPLLAALLLGAQAGFSFGAVRDIALEILLPFVLGQVSRPLTADWAQRNRSLLGLVDRGSILMIVYVAFSEGVTNGIWHQVDAPQLLALLGVDIVLLAAVLAFTATTSRLLGFRRADEITIVFCGSKKSLASGLPIASVLFAGQAAAPLGLLVLPLMLFHQIQLMVCASIARRYASPKEQKPAPLARPRLVRA